MARLKQAKEEAGKEIAEFRAQMEAEFQRKLAEQRMILLRHCISRTCSPLSSNVIPGILKSLAKLAVELETEAKIGHLKKEAARISHDVVQMLLKHVTTVKN
ncbi:hypothetical protein NC652_026656 [Populus alba x Populus x berolinensis]|nr:hypothetical protein NC652_026656 [Populus alba x Populus x berolinensis]